MDLLRSLLPTGIAIVLLMAVAFGMLRSYGAPHALAPVGAILRGLAQLAVVSLILAGVIRNPWWVAAFLLVMFAVASVTSARRLGWSWSRYGVVAGCMATGVIVSLAIVFVTGAVDLSARYALALGGIVIGNAMSVATLSGRRFAESARGRWEEVEGWLALGATRRQATLDNARGAVYSALIPTVDQTATTGLVTLPGAFVGAIFGGLSPLQAGRFQIVVLAAIMAAGAITAVLLVSVLAPVRRRPRELA